MNPNLTFFMQVINFGITYWVLNKFMFKPVLLFLQKKKKKEKQELESIAQKEHELLQLHEKKEQELATFKEDMKGQYCFAPVKTPAVPSKVACKVDEKEAEKLIKEAEGLLLKRVPHVD